jgi:hypothetical protein
MKTLVRCLMFIFVVPIFLESCNGEPNIQKETTGFRYGTAGTEVTTYRINDHEYIGRLIGGDGDWATHSGSCPNPIHKCGTVDTVYLVVDGKDTTNISK